MKGIFGISFGLVLALPVVAATSVSAQADCSGSNRVTNCSFELGDPPEEWDLILGENFARSPIAEHGSFAGSLEAASTVIGGIFGTLLSSNCFPVPSPADFRFGGSFRRSAIGSSYCSVDLKSFATAECNYWERTGNVSSPDVVASPDTWAHAVGSGSVVGPFALLQLTCTAYGPDPFLFDTAFATPVAAIEVPTLRSFGLVLLIAVLALAGSVRLRSAHWRARRDDA